MAPALRTPLEGPGRGRVLLELLALSVVWSVLYLPGFERREFVNEEGRRALPAREMARSGDFVVPHIFGRVYLAKPPGIFWMIAAASPGGVDRATTRLPSLLATLGIAFVLWWIARREPGRVGLLAGMFFLFSPLGLEKGMLGEIEAPFGLLVFAGSAAAWTSGRRASRVWAAGFFFGFAALTKGPPAWVFLGATTMAMGFSRAIGWRTALRRGFGVLLISTAITGIWVGWLLQNVEWGTLQEVWSKEVIGTGFSWQSYLGQRASYISGVLAGFLPASGFVLAALVSRDGRRRFLESESTRVALLTVAFGLAFFLFFPRSRPRYVYPLLPWLSLAGAHVLSPAFAQHADTLGKLALSCARNAGIILGILGLAAAGAGAVQLAGFNFFELELEAKSSIPILAIAGASILALRFGRSPYPGRALIAAAMVLASVRLFQLTQIAPPYADRYQRAAVAAELDRLVPPDAQLYTNYWGEFNLLAHSQRRILFALEPAERLSPGDYLIHSCPREDPASCAALVCGRGPRRAEWKELHRLRCPTRPYDLALLRRTESAARPDR